MEALACTMMVAVLSSRISFRRGVGSRLSSSIRTERVSLEMRNCRSNFSRFKRPSNKREKKTDTSKFYTWFKKQFSHGPRSSPVGSSSASMHCKGFGVAAQARCSGRRGMGNDGATPAALQPKSGPKGLLAGDKIADTNLLRSPESRKVLHYLPACGIVLVITGCWRMIPSPKPFHY